MLVTGASSGIGAAATHALAEAGFTVYAGVRNEDDGRRIGALHAAIRPLQLDVTSAAQIAAAAGVVRSGGVRLVGLVNNAGIAIGGPLELVTVDELRGQFEVNCFGAIAVTQAFLPLLREGRSRVIFVGSIAGRVPMPYIGPYSASKFALRAFADALRVELAPGGVEVYSIEPGSVATPIWEKGRAVSAALMARLTPASPPYYRRALEAIVAGLAGEERSGMPVERVAGAIVKTLVARRPPAHRLLGAPARIGALLALLPPALHDRFLRATMRLP